MADGNGELIRHRISTAEQQIEMLAERDLSFAERLARVEQAVRDVQSWLKLQTTALLTFAAAVAAGVAVYLITHGG